MFFLELFFVFIFYSLISSGIFDVFDVFHKFAFLTGKTVKTLKPSKNSPKSSEFKQFPMNISKNCCGDCILSRRLKRFSNSAKNSMKFGNQRHILWFI